MAKSDIKPRQSTHKYTWLWQIICHAMLPILISIIFNKIINSKQCSTITLSSYSCLPTPHNNGYVKFQSILNYWTTARHVKNEEYFKITVDCCSQGDVNCKCWFSLSFFSHWERTWCHAEFKLTAFYAWTYKSPESK